VSNPFKKLQPVLELIADKAKVLPATGQAVEELVRPDHEEVIDRVRSGEDKELDVVIEEPNRKRYVELTELHRTEKHLLRYFLDGSARTFFLGDALEWDRLTPVHAAQIGAAAVHRRDDGTVKVERSVHKIVLMMDKNKVSFGGQVEQLVKSLGPQFDFYDTMEEDGETEKIAPGGEPRSRAAHKAYHIMALEERNLAQTLKQKLREDEWLVLDGSLGKDFYSLSGDGDVRIIGVCKSFSREPRFKLSRREVVNLYELLRELPFSARTCAFSVRSGKVAVWYVRVREQRHLDYPLMGVLKVELPNPTGKPVPSEKIDEISRALIAERNVTPHGKDVRWHVHLYPIPSCATS
jgi:hypothetical protein